MSNPLAIAGVTAVLRNLLDNGVVESNLVQATGTKVVVTAVPPDLVRVEGAQAQTQLNLFLHGVTVNPALRNLGYPSRDAQGNLTGNPPLALDLHYLLTAYGAEELHAEILLGYAMSILHDTPVLDRRGIRDALTASVLSGAILPPAWQALAASDLADQIETIKITPALLSTEEVSKLWGAMQAHYRPTVSYQVSVVTIESRRSVRSALPILTRRGTHPASGREQGIVADEGTSPGVPSLVVTQFPGGQVAARAGDAVQLIGHLLAGSARTARLTHPRHPAGIELPLANGTAPDEVVMMMPSVAAALADWMPGVWAVAVALQRPGEHQVRLTNALPLPVAPWLDVAGAIVTRGTSSRAVAISVVASPAPRAGQQVTLNVGGQEAFGVPDSDGAGRWRFEFPDLPAGPQWVRMRVDGVDSQLVDRSTVPPSFDGTQRMVIPA